MNQVDHPAHYNAGKFEVIDVIEDWRLGFNLGNAVKYIARADHKGSELVDLEKARWYIDRQIELSTKRLSEALQETRPEEKQKPDLSVLDHCPICKRDTNHMRGVNMLWYCCDCADRRKKAKQ